MGTRKKNKPSTETSLLPDPVVVAQQVVGCSQAVRSLHMETKAAVDRLLQGTEMRTITLTGRRPAHIHTANWPIIAQASDDSYTGADYAKYLQGLAQGEYDTYHLTVRQHENGRVLVYGEFAPGWRGGEPHRGGKLLDNADDVVNAITDVGDELGLPERVIRACIIDLPPEEI